MFAPTQNIFLSVLLSAIAGFAYVVQAMIIAYPEYKRRDEEGNNGDPKNGKCYQTFLLTLNVLFFAVGSIGSTFGSFYGPVSIAVPVEYGSRVLFNAIAMGLVLKINFFNKSQATGTIVVFFSIVSLIDVGPGVQDGQLALELLRNPLGFSWSMILLAAQVVSGILLIFLSRTKREISKDSQVTKSVTLEVDARRESPSDETRQLSSGEGLEEGRVDNKESSRNNYSFYVLLAASVSSAVAANSVAKILSTVDGAVLAGFLMLLVVQVIQVLWASILSAVHLDQGIFIPIYSVASLTLNMITGILFWEDWRVTDSWVAYISVFCIMMLGVYLLSEVDLVEMYFRKKCSDGCNEVMRKVSKVRKRSVVQREGPSKPELKDKVTKVEKETTIDVAGNTNMSRRRDTAASWADVLCQGDKEMMEEFTRRRTVAGKQLGSTGMSGFHGNASAVSEHGEEEEFA